MAAGHSHSDHHPDRAADLKPRGASGRPRLIVATAGWSIPPACGPRLAGDGTHLQRYARVLRGVEINSSAYRDHSATSYAKWARLTPPRFLFSVKLPQAITHDAALRATRRPLEAFLETLTGLGRRLGPLIVQTPPSLAFERGVVRRFFTLLRERFDGDVACEPRHASWFAPEAEAMLVKHRIARVAADPAVVPEAAHPGGWPGLVYYRLHGSPRKYWSIYDLTRIEAWTTALQRVPRKTPTWCVFDNTAASGALWNALQMLDLLDRGSTGSGPSR